MINRVLKGKILNKFNSGKAVIIMGARQTGKTTLLRQLFKGVENVYFLNGDETDVQALFEEANSDLFKAHFSGFEYVVIDEAQRISDIGIKLKLITDQLTDVQLFATGSSSFDLANKINEPLTGRKWEYRLFPLSFLEMVDHHGILKERRLLNHRLIYGYYPDVVMHEGNEKETLRQLSDSYLYKDILMWENIKKPDKLLKLLQALALQIGNEVSYNELGKTVGLDNQTVEKYIQLLEKTYIIFRLGAFSRNLRKELKKGRKIYFYDNGIRNALITNFSPASNRNDMGALWENFMISERQKHIHYENIWANCHFWRTQDQQEIDYIEEMDGKMYAFEFKWNPEATQKLSKTFSAAYPNHEYSIINPSNFEPFLGLHAKG
ncbi:MAG TPA: ATP-binding protein [Bacteroidales bacterium]|nr:ATP-binding protein [Bacteroidales bacterium]